jgi:hypothetical protein
MTSEQEDSIIAAWAVYRAARPEGLESEWSAADSKANQESLAAFYSFVNSIKEGN